MTAKKQLTPTDVQIKYGVPVRTLARWRAIGVGPAYARMGGRIFYPRSKLIEWKRLSTYRPRTGSRRKTARRRW